MIMIKQRDLSVNNSFREIDFNREMGKRPVYYLHQEQNSTLKLHLTDNVSLPKQITNIERCSFMHDCNRGVLEFNIK